LDLLTLSDSEDFVILSNLLYFTKRIEKHDEEMYKISIKLSSLIVTNKDHLFLNNQSNNIKINSEIRINLLY